ncbi:DUF6602 domain-containing protein [Lacrimispora aerotolerans]|uniref:DUF6602 domain-containing protein n=1 Tax=Lacrimispora aerotolerans TaxID=36832 RepID=UPI000690E6A2|nr:DUF6602 domain-containing protein [Lacrimispora aerotolerans]
MEQKDPKTKEMKNEEKMSKAINQLGENYINMERSIVEQLKMMTPSHHLTTGTFREEVWKSMFEMMIPKKYCIDQGVFIIDSNGEISDEVDLAIFDEMYTPYIFKYNKIKFIPIEAVAIVVQCKSTINSDEKIDDLKDWLKSINKLTTSQNSVVRIINGLLDNDYIEDSNKAQTGTRPIKILCATQINDKSAKKILDKKKFFDLIVTTKENRLKMYVDKIEEDFNVWYNFLNHNKSDRKPAEYKTSKNFVRNLENLKVKDKDGNENVIMSLTFQLNQLLMIINNPMLFPHKAYVDMFNREFQNYKK